MEAFGDSLNWNAEESYCANSLIKVKASHYVYKPRAQQTKTAQCSVASVDNTVAESVPLYLIKKCCIPPQREIAVHVATDNAPAVTTAQQRPWNHAHSTVVIAEDVHWPDAPKAFHMLVIARTVCH